MLRTKRGHPNRNWFSLLTSLFPTPTPHSREEENEVGGMCVCVTFSAVIKNQQERQRRNGSHSRKVRELLALLEPDKTRVRLLPSQRVPAVSPLVPPSFGL